MKPLKPVAEVALGLIARREHSAAELRRKLVQKGYPPAEVKVVLADMVARNYVNDARYAVARARYRVRQSKWGWGRVAQELAAAGIVPDDIAAAKLALEEEGVSLTDGAAAVVRRKMLDFSNKMLEGQMDKEDYYKKKQKALAALVRKGFSLAEAKEALDAMAGEG